MSWKNFKEFFSILGTSYARHDKSELKVEAGGLERNKFSWRALWMFVGPGFLVSIAYIDPGNITTDIVSGAKFNYMLIWIIGMATSLGFLLQYLSGKLGMVTGYHLAELCRLEYGGEKSLLTILMWVLMEIAVMAADIPEILGAGFAWNILSFGRIPLWAGVIISTIDTFALLGIQYFGVRYLEAFISLLVLAISVCFFVELGMSPVAWTPSSSNCPPISEWCSHFDKGICPIDYPKSYCGFVWQGFIPYLDSHMIFTALSLFGSVVMPHNLYLHSGLALTRKLNTSSKVQIKWGSIYSVMELALSLFISFLINASVLMIAGTMFYPSASNNYQTQVGDGIGFDTANELLKNVLGNAAASLFGVALLASAHSSTIAGTYAGQFIMEGFLNLKIAPWKRNLITRSVAIIPSLIIAIVAGKSGSTLLILISSMIMSIQLPFALVPLLRMTASYSIMGEFKSHLVLTSVCGLVGVFVVSANFYAVYDAIFGSGSLHGAILILVIVVVLTFALAYLSLIIYLIWRPLGAWLKKEGVITLQAASAGYISEEDLRKAKSVQSNSSDDIIEISESLPIFSAKEPI